MCISSEQNFEPKAAVHKFRGHWLTLNIQKERQYCSQVCVVVVTVLSCFYHHHCYFCYFQALYINVMSSEANISDKNWQEEYYFGERMMWVFLKISLTVALPQADL